MRAWAVRPCFAQAEFSPEELSNSVYVGQVDFSESALPYEVGVKRGVVAPYQVGATLETIYKQLKSHQSMT